MDILEQKREGLNQLAKTLLEREVIYNEDLVKIFGERPFKPEKLFDNNINSKPEKTKEEKEIQLSEKNEDKNENSLDIS